RRSSRIGYRTNETVRQRRSITIKKRRNGQQLMSEENKEWLKCEQNDVQPDLRKRDCDLSPHVFIGTMNEVCLYCKALTVKGEAKGMCCAAGKIKLPQLEEPPEPLKMRWFKTAINMMPSDTHKIVIHVDKTPAGEHVRRFNAPTIDEVAIVITRDQFDPRDIVLHRRNDQLVKIGETHRCNDALQYPIIFWDE
ncbi:unnamed protein product, partial [Onchocerca ochengi]